VTAPLHPREAATTWWEDEGRRIAGQLRDVSAALVVGPNADHSAYVALGIARAESERRHVALGDLTGDLAPLYAVAGGEDAFGLTDCLRQELPLNDIARPAPDASSLFILPAGSPPVACEEILGHERWRKLVNGFAKSGALLLLVVPPDAPGFESLATATSGIVLVGAAAARTRDSRVLAAVSAPAELPSPSSSRNPQRGSKHRRTAALATTVLVAVAALGWLSRGRIRAALRATEAPHPAARSDTAPPALSAGKYATAATPAAAPPPRADTVRLTDPVNPADTSATAPFAVEVMAANTLAGANSYLSDHARSTALRGATVSPVIVGGSASVWYKIVAGAWHVRAGADSLLAALRHDGLVRGDEGRVVRVPYALVIADNLDRSQAITLHDTWQQRGFDAYMLVQDDGAVRLLAGAFETPAQAASLASALRAAGVAPVLAFRTGRMY
jgi:hypothetical protein